MFTPPHKVYTNRVTNLRKQLVILACFVLVYLAFFFFHPGHASRPVDISGVGNNLTLFEEPKDGRKPLLDGVENAQAEIDVEMYLLSDKEIIAALKSAHSRGVKVNILLEEHPFGSPSLNQTTYQALKSSGIAVSWANPTFSLTHEKVVVIDQKEAFILTQNLTASSFSKNREYDILDTNIQDVAQIEKIFFADAKRQAITSTDTNLVVSPTNARDVVMSLLKSATKEIAIEMEIIDDSQVIQLLEQKAENIPVEVVLPDFSKTAANKNTASQLRRHGVQVRTLSSPYIHAKLIVIDALKAYVGSVNLTTQSMDENRELGIIISQNDIVQKLQTDFQSDWDIAKE